MGDLTRGFLPGVPLKGFPQGVFIEGRPPYGVLLGGRPRVVPQGLPVVVPKRGPARGVLKVGCPW
jgi:hypothetical protein